MYTSFRTTSPNFEAAQVNILATSDNHGNVLTLPLLAQTVENNKKDIFVKPNDKSTLNLFAVAGDWFINPSKKGFITMPKMTNGDIQHKFLNKFIGFVHEQAGEESNFDTVFTMGNHDLDGGDKFMYKVMKNSEMKTLTTNVDMEKSPGIKKVMKNTDNKVVKSVTYEIPDDKNPDLKHKVLVLGVTIPSMQFYNPNLLKQMKFLDDCNKKDTNLTENDLQKTFNSVKEEVENFKEENPKGAVVLLSHTGAPISKMIRKHVPDINIILNGHDHKNLTSLKTGSITNIDSLGADNNMIKSFNLKFDDDGELETDVNTFYSKTTVKDNLDSNPLQLYITKVLSKDLKPLVSLTDISGNKAELDYGDSIRYKNSYLANWLTSAVKRSVREKCDDKNVIVGIQSSIIRGGLKDGSNNLDIMKVFDGVSEDLSNVQVGKVKGQELVGLIVENVKGNLKAPKRNTIIQWSDIQVNRTQIDNILSGNSKDDLASTIKVRNEDTNEFEPINLEKDYTIAIGEKFLVKDDIEWPGKIRDRFVSLGTTYDQLLRSYISSDDINYQLKVTPKTKEERIL
ncbi:MAG: metallophosphoesterase [Candidatus Gastranaerophilales bacterium]|nr:metallophosphoesterase [Candidatus Gastranaerophilales bacterium]